MAVSLPGIKKIGFVECSKLAPQLMNKSIAGLPISVDSPVTDIPFTGDASCDASNAPQNNGRLEKSTVSFITTMELPTNDNLAFVVECANGRKYIIGRKEAPFPLVSVTRKSGTPGGDASSNYVEVSLSQIKSLLEVI